MPYEGVSDKLCVVDNNGCRLGAEVLPVQSHVHDKETKCCHQEHFYIPGNDLISPGFDFI